MVFSLRQLNAYIAVAETGGFTAAAERLNLTQSAVSMLVRQFEDEVGLQVFHRSGRGVQLTDFGTEIRPTVQRILGDLRNLGDGAADLRALRRGHLRLAVPQMLACSWLPGIVSGFRADHPEVGVSLIDTTGDRVVEAVAGNEAEIGIGPERALPPGVSAVYLWDAPIQLVVPRGGPLASGRGPVAWAQLRSETWIRYSDAFNLHLQQTVAPELPPPAAHEIRVRGLTTALALVGQGHGLTAAPSYTALFADVFNIVLRPLEGSAGERRYFLYMRQGHDLTPAAAVFRDMAIAQAPGPAEGWP